MLREREEYTYRIRVTQNSTLYKCLLCKRLHKHVPVIKKSTETRVNGKKKDRERYREKETDQATSLCTKRPLDIGLRFASGFFFADRQLESKLDFCKWIGNVLYRSEVYVTASEDRIAYRNRRVESYSSGTGLYAAQNCIKQPRYLLHRIL